MPVTPNTSAKGLGVLI